MVGWHCQLNKHEFEQTSGDSKGQGILERCCPWGCKELDTTERLNNNKSRGQRAHGTQMSENEMVGWHHRLKGHEFV